MEADEVLKSQGKHSYKKTFYNKYWFLCSFLFFVFECQSLEGADVLYLKMFALQTRGPETYFKKINYFLISHNYLAAQAGLLRTVSVSSAEERGH